MYQLTSQVELCCSNTRYQGPGSPEETQRHTTYLTVPAYLKPAYLCFVMEMSTNTYKLPLNTIDDKCAVRTQIVGYSQITGVDFQCYVLSCQCTINSDFVLRGNIFLASNLIIFHVEKVARQMCGETQLRINRKYERGIRKAMVMSRFYTR